VLHKRPRYLPELEAFWQAFWALHPTRLRGSGVEPIQPQAIAAYLEIIGANSSADRTRYYGFITALDQVWLRWHQKKSSSQDKG
jgi:hypothetical protein